MKIKKITINNYKSLSHSDNIIKITDDTIVLVGKNGSGKTNILTALRGFQFFSNIPHEAIFAQHNRQDESQPVNIDFLLQLKPEDFSKNDYYSNLKIDFIKYSEISFFQLNAKHYQMKFNGLFSLIIEQDTELSTYAKELSEIMSSDKRSRNVDDFLRFEAYSKWIANYSKIFMGIDFEWLKANYKDKIAVNKIEYINKQITSFFIMFRELTPKIFSYQEQFLNDTYSLDELKKDGQKQHFNSKDILNKLICAINETPQNFERLITEKDPGKNETLQENFREGLQRLSKDFNKFYNNEREKISIRLRVDSQRYYFTVRSDGANGAFNFSERSNGLKWYLCFFIALRAAGIEKNALILIDEPAVHLHIDAQKEVLKLFDNLEDNGNQIIYTTHSPAMLDVSRLSRIRTIQKERENTHIRMVHESITGINNQETLSPIVQAMGCSLRHELNPAGAKMNLIVEGITDYYYLQAMLRFDRNKDKYLSLNIIPACSADKIPNLLSVMFGWGCKFKVLLDNDDEGTKVYAVLKKLLHDSIDEYVCFVSIDSPKTIESLLSANDQKKYFNDGKTINAKLFMDKIISGTDTPDHVTITNFDNMFDRLKIKISLDR